MRLVLAAILCFGLFHEVLAESMLLPVTARVTNVVDGDTLDVRAKVWLGHEVSVLVRVLGIDTPELRGKCAAEIEKARAAQAFVLGLVPLESLVVLNKVQSDKYAGRVDAEVELPDGRVLAELVIAAGHARPYSGGQRQGWCP